MTSQQDAYSGLKARAYGAAKVTAGCGDPEAQASGYADVFDLIMSNSAHSRQATFVGLLPTILCGGDCQVLLDGMAWEYAKLESWAAYTNREVRETAPVKGSRGDHRFREEDSPVPSGGNGPSDAVTQE
jgi:hypothetical protein